ncbi:MAG: hypothetical protein NVS2B9_19150 [Myxococcales bacterium]
MTRTLLAVALALAAAPASAAEGPAASTPATAAATYKVEAPRSLEVRTGEKASVRIAVVPRADSHVSPEAPVSVAISGTPSIEVPQPKLGRPEARETPQKGVAFDIPFIARAAGPGTVDANLIFFICTEKLCERHKEHVQLAVLAR